MSVGGAWGWPARSAAAAPRGARPGRPPARRRGRAGRPDNYQLAGNDPADLLLGRRFQRDTGLSGIVESDFFAWPLEVGGLPLVKAVANRVARFDWPNAPGDIAAILYETVIPPDERRQLGEYYTPHRPPPNTGGSRRGRRTS